MTIEDVSRHKRCVAEGQSESVCACERETHTHSHSLTLASSHSHAYFFAGCMAGLLGVRCLTSWTFACWHAMRTGTRR